MDGAGQRDGLSFPFPDPPEEGQAIQVAPGVHWMRLPLPMALDHINVYALEDADGWTIVDCGIDTTKTRKIWEQLIAGPLSGRPIKRVLVTHHHPDHVGLAGWFQRDHGAELLISRTSWLFARMLSLDIQDRPTPEMIAFWQGAGMAPEMLAERRESRPLNFADVLTSMPLGFTQLKEGDRLHLAGRNWQVRLGNGHAPDLATLWSEDGVLLAGDQVIATISPNIGVYATEPEADPLVGWLESCNRFAEIASPDQLVLPGHKLPFKGLPKRLSQLIDNHHHALKRLETFLQTPHTACECFPLLYKRKIGAGEYGLAMVEAVAHVNHLFALGKVTRTKRGDGAWLWQSVPV